MSRSSRLRSRIQYDGFIIEVGADFRNRLRISDPARPNPDYPDNSPFKFLPMMIDNVGFQMDIRKQPFQTADLIHSLSTSNGGIIKEPDYSDSPTNTVLNPLQGWIELFIDHNITGDDTTDDSIASNIGAAHYDLFFIPNNIIEDRLKIMKGSISIEDSVTQVN